MTTHTPVLNLAAFSPVAEVTETYFVVVEVSPKSTPDRPIYLPVAKPVATQDEAAAKLVDEAAKRAADSRELPPRDLRIIEVMDAVSRTITLR